jgi:hypothetical protein
LCLIVIEISLERLDNAEMTLVNIKDISDFTINTSKETNSILSNFKIRNFEYNVKVNS